MFAASKVAGAASGPATYIEDVFSTYVYAGNGSTQTITNNIDLSTKGGLVWIKKRSSSVQGDNVLTDTAQGLTKTLVSNSTAAAANYNGISSFSSSGFALTSDAYFNANSAGYASWTFRKQPKFFDVVTYTGTGSVQNISHNLGSAPGFIVVKKTNTTSSWMVYHRSLGAANGMYLQTTSASFSATTFWNSTDPTSSVFTVGTSSETNGSGDTYVAYIFAHDAGGFGLTGTDNVISCGSFVQDINGDATIDLGYEPQYLLIKCATDVSNWFQFDNTKGMPVTQASAILFPNTNDSETTTSVVRLTSTGFKSIGWNNLASQTMVYIAVRRGPMRTPTVGTSVFQPVAYTGTNVDNRLVNTTIRADMAIARIRSTSSSGPFYVAERLRGSYSLATGLSAIENTDADSFMTPTVGYGNSFSAMNGFGVGNDVTRQLNQSSTAQLAYAFQRAPGFFDEVCYTGNGSTTQAIAHNLKVTPELIIIKSFSPVINEANWIVYAQPLGTSYILQLMNANEKINTFLPFSAINSSTFSIAYGTGSNSGLSGNTNGYRYVAYLFASCPGVSKVGSYTGTGATQTIDCGFTSGARYVMIKRTDVAGGWYVWDTARGMTAGTNPSLQYDANAAEVNANSVYTTSVGFQIVSTASGINASGGSYIYHAIA